MEVLIVSLIFTFSYAAVLQHFVYKEISPNKLDEAREFGKKAYLEYRNATEDSEDVDILNEKYEEYFLKCDELGKDMANHILDRIKKMPLTNNSKALLSMGMQPLVARFLVMDEKAMAEGINDMCTKYEMQLQCQLGFGESRSAIYRRIDELKNSNGNLKLLIEKDCNSGSDKYEAYRCIGKDTSIWSSNCAQQMAAYNESRLTIGKQIALLHFEAVQHVLNITSDKNLDREDQFLTAKEIVQSIFRQALRKIADLEGEKCQVLEKVLECVGPNLRQHCGAEAEDVFETSVLIGYLDNERNPDLADQFLGFEVDPSPSCMKLNRHIVGYRIMPMCNDIWCPATPNVAENLNSATSP